MIARVDTTLFLFDDFICMFDMMALLLTDATRAVAFLENDYNVI